MDKALIISDMVEKKVGRGEDSDPILFRYNNTILIGVFDGMGGAGGAECLSDFSHDGIDMTKAYVGSRIVRDAIENSVHNNPEILLEPNFSDCLVGIIKTRYMEENEKYPPKSKGGLRSKLIKEYPTTLAMSCITKHSDQYVIDSYWAGDSRNYLWTPNGLFQISKDDLKGNLDPMQNLREDAPMSNCVQADAPFRINHKQINLADREKFVVISATDGCFGYYPSPMDFENALFESLKNSLSLTEFKDKLSSAFANVTADDFSYSIAAFGFANFNEFKSSLRYLKRLLKKYISKRRGLEQEVRKSKEKLARLEESLRKNMTSSWSTYRGSYLKYMEQNEER